MGLFMGILMGTVMGILMGILMGLLMGSLMIILMEILIGILIEILMEILMIVSMGWPYDSSDCLLYIFSLFLNFSFFATTTPEVLNIWLVFFQKAHGGGQHT